MRILIASHHRTLLGGVETYLAAVMPALAASGHELLFAHEAAADNEHELIPLPPGTTVINAEESVASALERIRQWKPNLAYIHALHLPEFQRAIVEEFPTVAFAHGYYGLCISGSKTWKRAPARPCAKAFDWKCLFYFHAKNCGGSSPVTMVQDYLLHKRQLAVLKNCKAILTHGGQTQREYIAQGIPENRVFALPHFVEKPALPPREHALGKTAK